MFKQIITACATVILGSSMAQAIDVSGVYSGGNNGQNLSISLNDQDGMVRGQVGINGNTLPLVGREINGKIQGIWRSPDGQDIPFAAAAGPNGLQIQTNGVSYALARGGGNVGQGQVTPQVGGQQPINPALQGEVPQVQLETRQGRVMQCDVPAGWQFSDTTNGVDVVAPDGSAWMSHTYLRGCGRTNCDMFLQNSMKSWPRFGIANVQVIGGKDLGQGSKLYEMQYTHGGRPMHAMVQVTVRPAVESFMAEMVLIEALSDNFEQCKPMLIAMAKSVRVMDGNAFCDNAKINGEIQKRANIRAQTAADIAKIRSDEYAYQSQMRDSMNLRSSDTLRDNTRFDDGSGNQYVGPLQAERMFKHDDGSVTYSTNNYDPVPPGATELAPSRYGAPR